MPNASFAVMVRLLAVPAVWLEEPVRTSLEAEAGSTVKVLEVPLSEGRR